MYCTTCFYLFTCCFIFQMNFPIPSSALSLRGDSFYQLIEQLCGQEAVELLRLQLIDNTVDLVQVDDVFLILQFESEQTAKLKEVLGIPNKDHLGKYSFFVLPGIRLKLEKLIRSLRRLLLPIEPSPTSMTAPVAIPPNLVQEHPFLIDLIHCLEAKSINEFSLDFIANLVYNLASTAKNAYRYKQSVKDFAASIYILGGRNLFEFIRSNIPGSLPSVTGLRSILTSTKYHFPEGEFQYARLKEFVSSSDCRYAFCAEDCTSVVPKVTYDSRSNSFVGFTLPLEGGFPCSGFFSTYSFNELESWHEQMDKSSLLNIYTVQALSRDSQRSIPPFLLAAYGTNGKYTSSDIVNRWSTIFDQCLSHDIRMLGFSADCDAKNLRAMRDSMGFFSRQQTEFLNHPSRFKISLLKVSGQHLFFLVCSVGYQS